MISEYFEEEELLSQLRMFFDEEEQENIDFKSFLGQLKEVDSETYEVKIKNRTFQIDKTTCDVEEIT